MKYYHAKSITMETCSISQQAYVAASESWLCTGCAQPKPGTAAVDLALSAPPPNIPMTLVSGVGITVMQRSFLAAIGANDSDLLIGSVLTLDGAIMPDFVTFRSVRQAVIRGDERSSLRVCEQCGREVYFPFGRGYLVGPVSEGVSVFESEFHLPIFGQEAYWRLSKRQWKQLRFEELPVVTIARDGRGMFPTERLA